MIHLIGARTPIFLQRDVLWKFSGILKKTGEAGKNRTALNGKNQISVSNQKHTGNFLLSLGTTEEITEQYFKV